MKSATILIHAHLSNLEGTVRSTERDVLLFLLAVASGSADAWSYLGLGHAFVANMTGNTVLTGIAVFQKNGDLAHPFVALVCYAMGAATASFFTRRVREGAVWARAVTLTLLLEAVIMAGAEGGWIAARLHAFPKAAPLSPLTVLLGCVAFAIGLQSGAMLQLKVPGIVTTYITGTWTTLMSGMARFATQKKRETPTQKLRFEERLLMQGGILAVYFLSAVLAGWLFEHQPLAVGAVAASCVMVVALYAAARGESIAGEV
jgi:uncharacterized membrane protein YoaK (UPF0700 family)